jgi:hypothetical protein
MAHLTPVIDIRERAQVANLVIGFFAEPTRQVPFSFTLKARKMVVCGLRSDQLTCRIGQIS